MRPQPPASVVGMVLVTVVVAGCGGNPAAPGAPPPAASPSTTTAATAALTPTADAAQPHILVLRATGTTHIDSLTYVLDGDRTTERSVSLPWRRSVDVPADGRMHTYSLTVDHHNGEIKLVAIFDGNTVGTASGAVSGGSGTARVGGDVRG